MSPHSWFLWHIKGHWKRTTPGQVWHIGMLLSVYFLLFSSIQHWICSWSQKSSVSSINQFIYMHGQELLIVYIFTCIWPWKCTRGHQRMTSMIEQTTACISNASVQKCECWLANEVGQNCPLPSASAMRTVSRRKRCGSCLSKCGSNCETRWRQQGEKKNNKPKISK